MSPDQRDVRPWMRCGACGHWARMTARCEVCGWETLQADHGGDALHALVDLDVYEDECRLSRIHSARWPEWCFESTRQDVARSLDLRAVRNHLKKHRKVPTSDLWQFVRGSLQSSLVATLERKLVGDAPRAATVEVSIRLRVLDDDLAIPAAHELRWLKIASPEAVAALRALDASDVEIVASGTLSLGTEGGTTQIVVTSKHDSLLTRVEVASGPDGRDGRVRTAVERRVVLRAGRPTTIPIPWGHAGMYAFVKDHEERPTSVDWVVLHPHGGEPLGLRIPTIATSLPPSAPKADVYLDLGSTISKFVLAATDGQPIHRRALATADLVEELGALAYDKRTLMRHPAAWAEWVRRALAGIQQSAARKDHFLGDVHLSLPRLDGVSVDAFQDGIGDVSARMAGKVVVKAEHELLHAHFLPVLEELRNAGTTYAGRRTTSQREANERDEERKKNDEAVAERAKHWAITNWIDGRKDPGAKRPALDRLAAPPDWMDQLTKDSERLSRVVLLDAGGMSLDVAVEEAGVLLADLSCSVEAGGGKIDKLLAMERERNGLPRYSDPTVKKVELAKWFEQVQSMGLPLDAELTRYREATREACSAFEPLAERIASKWTGKSALAISTGGGARNPFLLERFTELLGANFWVLTDAHLAKYLSAAVGFGMERRGRAADRFLMVRGWNEEGPAHLLYDKFAVVGGMLSQ